MSHCNVLLLKDCHPMKVAMECRISNREAQNVEVRHSAILNLRCLNEADPYFDIRYSEVQSAEEDDTIALQILRNV